MKKIGLTILVLLALAGAAAIAYYFLKPAAPNVSLEFSKPDQIYVGKPFNITISYSNSSDQVLKDAKFSLQLPPEISFLGQSTDQRVSEESLGDIGPGNMIPKDFALIALNGAQSFKRVTAKLNYMTSSASRTPFEATSNADISIGQPAVGLIVTTPQSVNSGENFDLSVKVQNNTQEDLKGVNLALGYPPVFKFGHSDDKHDLVNNQQYAWPTLLKGQSDEITVNGNLLGADQSRYDFAATVSSNFTTGQTYTINTQEAETAITPSPLTMRATVNGADTANYIAQAGQTLDYVIYYKNNSSVPLSNLKLSAKLVGAMFDFPTLQTDAVFDSINSVLSWSQQNASDLSILNLGEEKQLKFQVKLKGTFPIQRLGDKNFTLKVNLNMESPTVPPNVAAQKTVSLVALETKVAGQTALKASGYFYDASSGILNKGVYPAKVDQKTQYTIHWTIINYSTDITNAVIMAKLAPGANFTGQIKSNADSQPTYDANTGIVTWNLGSVPATKGVLSAPYEAIFQIEYTPSSVQAGEDIQLMGATTFSATDSFTGGQIGATDAEITSLLPDDTKVTAQDRRVRP